MQNGNQWMREALRLARKGFGLTSPNPMVGAVLVKGEKIIGRGWHHRAGFPHAEIEALQDAEKHGHNPKGATLYVTLEPCCTHGRTPPCTDAIISAGIKRIVVGATDPNPKHAGKGFQIMRRAGIEIVHGTLNDECAKLTEAFNHWIVHRTPFVTVKAAMTLDGKIATASGESKWITGEQSRAFGMKLRQDSDAILVGVNTILADDPALTVRKKMGGNWKITKPIRRIVLDSMARSPLDAKVLSDEFAKLTTIAVSENAPKNRVVALAKNANVIVAPQKNSTVDLKWLLKNLGSENVTSLLVEGGGEVNASFLLDGFTNRVAFFYAPKILGGRMARKAVGGDGVLKLKDAIQLREVEWEKIGNDLLMTALVEPTKKK
jgi:diaminohydroxyphosphoribosylaminopyrimidine deaminase/5-amino-6-(5-phosphoribosylamino)uracil reductase